MNNIGLARKAAGLSQKEIAITIGVSRPTVSEWESGKKTPAGKNLLELANLLHCSVDYLLGRTAEPNPPELVIPDALKDVQVAFNRGEFEDLTQDDVNRLAEYAEFIKAQRAKREGKGE